MSLIEIATLGIAVTALHSGIFHAWLHWAHQRGRIHLWHALVSLSACGFTVCTFLAYGAQELDEARRWQSAQLMFSAPLVLGFFLYNWSFLGLTGRRPARWVAAYSLVLFGSALTDRIYEHRRIGASGFGLDYVHVPLSTEGWIVTLGYGVVAGYVLFLYSRHARWHDTEFRVTACSIGGMSLTALIDMGRGFGWHDWPFLSPLGYLGIVAGNSAMLIQRFVQSMRHSEALAENLHDLVERRTAELRQKDLELTHGERMAVVGTLAAGVAHEINNPMAFLSSNLNRLEELWNKPDGAGEALEILGECQEGADRVRATVAELLSLARRDPQRVEPVDLSAVVASVLRMARYEARERAVLVKDLASCRPFSGDVRLVAQVVMNLVMNGLQAIAKGDPEHNHVLVRTRDLGDRIQLCVEDTGPGIPEPFRNEIFDPFFTTKQAGEGTGLGLAVTRKIVREHRGEIHVESSDAGTRMTVDFPRETGLDREAAARS